MQMEINESERFEKISSQIKPGDLCVSYMGISFCG